MIYHVIIVSVCLSFVISLHVVTGSKANSRRFPESFCFGAGSSAYQIEGAWNVDGKGPSMWDHMVHTDPNSIMDKSNADVASNSYYLYKEDIAMLKYLGVQSYRFSISWSRILPNGRTGHVNQLGLAYYNNLINELLANGIQPFVTMYHFDLPQALSAEGGWLNRNIPDWFKDYAEILFENFGDRVKYWVTVNEPFLHCILGYEIGIHAPGIQRISIISLYECTRNMILAHANAYRLYEKKFKAVQKGQIGITTDFVWADPGSESKLDVGLAELYTLFTFDLMVHPIFSKEGNYPKKIIQIINLFRYLLPTLLPFSPEEENFIKGSADFLGINHYSSFNIDSLLRLQTIYKLLLNIPNVLPTGQTSEYGEPYGMYNSLIYIQKTYGTPVYVTENGYSTDAGLEDYGRVNYLRNYLNATLNAFYDGADVRGYFVWSLMDNFEWSVGYLTRYGLHEVDFDDPNRARTPRKSAHVYKEIIGTRMIDYN